MPVTPIGPASVQISSIATLLSNSATFRTWVGAANAAEALESIHPVGLPSPEDDRPSYTAAELAALRPLAIVNFDMRTGLSFSRQALGMFIPGGTVVVGFEADIADEDGRNFADAAYAFLNKLGVIVEEMLETGEGSGYPVIQNARIMPPRRSNTEEKPALGDFMVALVTFELGLRRQ